MAEQAAFDFSQRQDARDGAVPLGRQKVRGMIEGFAQYIAPP
jgi:hypothetical protein